jgi:hypothetical protein
MRTRNIVVNYKGKETKMGLLVMYAVFMTIWALGMTIEYTKATSYREGYEDGYKCNCSSEDCPDSYKS